MSTYRQLVHDHDFFQDFDSLVDRDKVKQHEISELKELVLKVAQAVETPMQRVQETFRQYTDHGWPHLGNLATHIRDFLPKGDDGALPINAVELAYLWLAILLHDVGMFVEEDERERIEASDDYAKHRRESRKRLELADEAEAAGRPVHARAIRDAVFAEFIRRRHAGRVHQFLATHLDAELTFRGANLYHDVGRLCESHGWGVIEPAGGQPADQCVAALDTEKLLGSTSVNLGYLACCLRLADILDFDRTRTPASAFQLVHFTEDVSRREWNKHLAIEGVRIDERSITYEARCPTPDDYVAVEHFLDWVDRELVECLRLIDRFPAKLAARYPLHLPTRVERKIRMANPRHKAGAFRFTLEYDRIMQLLMDKSLYPDPALFLRELLQNALDACRYQQALADDAGLKDKYVPRIQVEDLSELPHVEEDPDNPEAWRDGPRVVFRDNGVGMSLRQVEDYFLRVGKSFYRSGEFEAEKERLAEKGIYLEACSQFGIGFLSCFLGGDRIEVITYRYGSTPLRVLIEGSGRLFLIEELDTPTDINQFVSPDDAGEDRPPRQAGTQVTVWLRPEWRGQIGEVKPSVTQTLGSIAVNQEFAVTVSNHSSSHKTLPACRSEKTPARFCGLEAFWDNLPIGAFESIMKRSTFEFKRHSASIRGQGAIWFLEKDGDIALERGLLTADSGNKAGSVKPSDFFEVLRDVRFGRDPGHSRDIEIGRKLDENGGVSQELRGLLTDLASTPTRPGYVENWFENRDVIRCLSDSSIRELKDCLNAKQVSLTASITWDCIFDASLYGIALPGGFQSWDPVAGNVEMPDWLPPGVSVSIDIRGDIAPPPAANRLCIPYPDSLELRSLVAKAAALHAVSLFEARCSDGKWGQWLNTFLHGFDSVTIANALQLQEIGRGVNTLRLGGYWQSGPFAEELIDQYGDKLPTSEFDGKAFVDTWWLPGYLDRQSGKDTSGVVDLRPLREALGM